MIQPLTDDAPLATLDPLADQVHSAIQGNPYLSGRKLRFEARQGRVVLRGTVATFFQKQMAQEALRRIDGIREIENELEVL
jgi:osmotically-inducible protein OsmY